MEQGSYLLIAPGMIVRNTGGEELGRVAEMVGEPGMDIFRGVILSPGLLSHKVFISQERITAVADDTVTVDVPRNAVAGLPPADGTI